METILDTRINHPTLVWIFKMQLENNNSVMWPSHFKLPNIKLSDYIDKQKQDNSSP